MIVLATVPEDYRFVGRGSYAERADERWDVYCNSSLTVRVTVDVEVAVGHGMVTRCVSEEAVE